MPGETTPAIPESESQLPDEGDASALVHLGFWQHPLVQNLLPLATSLVFHISLLIVGILFFAASRAITHSVFREQVIIPDTAMIPGAAAGGIPNPGLGGDPN